MRDIGAQAVRGASPGECLPLEGPEAFFVLLGFAAFYVVAVDVAAFLLLSAEATVLPSDLARSLAAK